MIVTRASESFAAAATLETHRAFPILINQQTIH